MDTSTFWLIRLRQYSLFTHTSCFSNFSLRFFVIKTRSYHLILFCRIADGHPIPIIQNITLSKYLSISSEGLRSSLMSAGMSHKAENMRVKSRLRAGISAWKLPMYDANKHGECWKIIGNFLCWWNISQKARSQRPPSSYRNILVSSYNFLSKKRCL